MLELNELRHIHKENITLELATLNPDAHGISVYEVHFKDEVYGCVFVHHRTGAIFAGATDPHEDRRCTTMFEAMLYVIATNEPETDDDI